MYLKKLGPDHPRTIGSLNNLAMTLLDAGRAEEALAMLREVDESLTRKPSPLLRAACERNLGSTLLRLRRFEEAERALLAAHELYKSDPNPRANEKTAARLVELYDVWDRPADAARWAATTRPTNPPAP